TLKLLEQGHKVVGVDNLNDYYPVELKLARNEILKKFGNYEFHQIDISEQEKISQLIHGKDFESIFHLAGQPGVRYSLENPHAYVKSNIIGSLNILEAVRHSQKRPYLFLASSSSVYGLSEQYPFREDNPFDKPVSFYGSTKGSMELMAHSYSQLYGIKATALRYFTVYGPWGRPDMAPFIFVKKILNGEEIEVFNHGYLVRDFTFVSDIVDGTLRLNEARKDPNLPLWDVFNIGCSNPRPLMDFIRAVENTLGVQANLKMMPHQPGDVYKTFADVSKISSFCGYFPQVSLEKGIEHFANWYKSFYRI
ncbi:MAG: GDP-mannose 4,6-dehydratase, partial [Bacteriovoracales bacterium]